MKKNIAIVTGGDSSEEVISVQSASLIQKSISKEKYDTYLVYIRSGIWTVNTENGEKTPIDRNDFSFQLNGKKVKFDGVYLILHGPPAENGKLQAYFDLIGMPYVGPGVLQSSLTFNKEVCKQYLNNFGYKSSVAILVKDISEVNFAVISEKIGYPCFVKPNEAGSSFGVTKVYEENQLEEALKKALTEDSSVMIEKFIKGTEVTCGVYKLNGDVHVLPITEIVSTKDFFDFEAKYTPGTTDEITPARLTLEQTKECQRLTGEIFKTLDLSGMSRVDFILEDGVFYMLEVNTIPGMSPGSIIPQQLRANGESIEEVITALVDQALA